MGVYRNFNTVVQITFLIFILAACKSEKEKLSEKIKSGEEKLFNDSTKSLNITEANAVFEGYLHYADANKDDTLSAAYLFKAGDLANGLGRPKETIALYDRMIKEYPDYRKTAAALFMQAFIYETSIQDKEKAKEKYKEFIQKYPDHKLAPSAQASLEQLNSNMTDEELIKSFQEKKQSEL